MTTTNSTPIGIIEATALSELPALTGTERQIEWAAKIRQGCFFRAGRLKARHGDGYVAVFGTTAAAWWIEHRERTIETLVKRADALPRAQRLVAAAALPALTGTERQVAWATEIRSERLADLVADDIAWEEDGTEVLAAAAHITAAAWWIERRERCTADALAAAARAAKIAA